VSRFSSQRLKKRNDRNKNQEPERPHPALSRKAGEGKENAGLSHKRESERNAGLSRKREREKNMLAYPTSERVKRKVVLSHKRERKRKILSCLTSGRRKKQNRDSRSANAKQKKRPA
jgi:hypothetical protein